VLPVCLLEIAHFCVNTPYINCPRNLITSHFYINALTRIYGMVNQTMEIVLDGIVPSHRLVLEMLVYYVYASSPCKNFIFLLSILDALHRSRTGMAFLLSPFVMLSLCPVPSFSRYSSASFLNCSMVSCAWLFGEMAREKFLNNACVVEN
jgi:hypothetical protein